MELDDDTRQLLQRSSDARSHQAMDQEAFLWSDAALPRKTERTAGKRGWLEEPSGGSQALTEKQRKERLYLQKLSTQEMRKKKGAAFGPRETDLGRLFMSRKMASAAAARLPPQPHGQLSFTAAFERELQQERPLLPVIDIEEVEGVQADSPATAVEQGGRVKKSWKDEVDAAIDSTPAASQPPTRPIPLLHGRKGGRRRGGLEDRLAVLIRSRTSNVLIAQHRQQQLLANPAALPITTDADGRYPSLLVKMVAGVEYYSIFFTLCVLCSPYNPPPSPLYIPDPTTLSLPSTLPSLVSFASTHSIPLSQLALILFSPQQRRDLRLPSDFSSPSYLLLMFPWFDVGQRMAIHGRVLVDVFDATHFDAQRGHEEEKKHELRQFVEAETKRVGDEAKEEQAETAAAPSQTTADVGEGEEERKRREAMRAVFGDLSADDISSLFDGAEEEDRQELLRRAEAEGKEAASVSPPPPPPAPPAKAFEEYRRVTLASLQSYTSLHHTCVVGVVRKVQWNGHGDVPSGPHFIRSRLPCFWLDDGTALVQVDVSLPAAGGWREVLLQGVAQVIWIGGARMNEDPAFGRGEVDGLSSMLHALGHPQQRGLRVMEVGEQSRWRMQPLHEQSLLPPVQLHQPHQLSRLKDILSGERKEGRVHVHVQLMHVQWTSEGECLAWLSDASLMPPATTVAASPPPSSCLVVAFHHFLHLQLLRSFLYPHDPKACSLVIQDLLLSPPPPASTATWPGVTADGFTELLLPRDDLRCEVVGFEQTQQHQQARTALRVLQATDPLAPSVHLTLPQHLAAPFATIPFLPPLSALLTSHALLGPIASPSLQLFGLFLIDGVIMQVHSAAALLRRCTSCLHESPYVRAERRSLFSSFCLVCKAVSNEPQPLVGRVVVDVKCSDVVQLLQVEISPAVLAALLTDVGLASALAVMSDEVELRAQLLSKRLRCACVCAQPRAMAVPVKELTLRGVDEARDLRQKV